MTELIQDVQQAVPLVNLTQSAVEKVWELITEEGNLDLKLRAYVTGGGCSGFKYGFSFEDVSNPDDTIVTKHLTNHEIGAVVQLLVDPISLQHLVGAEIDYKEDLEGARFIIHNPGAKTTCGCGSSFSIDN